MQLHALIFSFMHVFTFPYIVIANRVMPTNTFSKTKYLLHQKK